MLGSPELYAGADVSRDSHLYESMGLCPLMDTEDECVTSGVHVDVHILKPCVSIDFFLKLPYIMCLIAIDHATEETVDTEASVVVVDTHEGISSV
jgi:hypothetical protein